jgi:hypothetical protein
MPSKPSRPAAIGLLLGPLGPLLDKHLHDSNVNIRPAFGAGGRYHFTPNFALTMRVGYPVSAVGLSFFF